MPLYKNAMNDRAMEIRFSNILLFVYQSVGSENDIQRPEFLDTGAKTG